MRLKIFSALLITLAVAGVSQAQDEGKILSGKLEAAQATEIKVDLQAYSGELRLKWIATPGMAMKAGDKLAELEAPDYADALERSREGLTAAELGLQAMKDAARQYEDGFPEQVLAAQRRLERAREELQFFREVDRKQQVRNNEMNLESSKFSIEDQEEELAQLEKLYKGNDLAKESQDIVLNRSKRRLVQSKERHKMAQDRHDRWLKVDLPRREQDLESAVKGAELEMQRIDTLKANGNADLKSKLTGAERRLKDAAQYHAKLEADSKALVLIAPHDGVMLAGGLAGNDGVAMPAKAGDKINRGQALVSVINTSTLHVTVPVLANARAKYQPGTKVAVKSDELAVSGSGTVKLIGVLVRDGKVSARIEVDNAEGKFLPGAKVGVSLPE
ncbi:MAG: HlyD family efflux transporter periplasmic adaptor subunit [Planctomycetes bacterium]|nr:HlyD family efflux transporter periplasmic adaptor subunit [Planctomycetota bacterium]